MRITKLFTFSHSMRLTTTIYFPAIFIPLHFCWLDIVSVGEIIVAPDDTTGKRKKKKVYFYFPPKKNNIFQEKKDKKKDKKDKKDKKERKKKKKKIEGPTTTTSTTPASILSTTAADDEEEEVVVEGLTLTTPLNANATPQFSPGSYQLASPVGFSPTAFNQLSPQFLAANSPASNQASPSMTFKTAHFHYFFIYFMFDFCWLFWTLYYIFIFLCLTFVDFFSLLFCYS